MKTGRAASTLGLDQGTVKNWIRDLPEFFTEGARGDGKMHREISQADLFALNTIRLLRTNGKTDWQEIRDFLATGQRFTELPVTALSIDTGETPVQAVQQAIQLKAELEIANARNADLQRRLDEALATGRSDRQLIEQLQREAGEWKGQATLLKEMLKEAQGK